MVGPAFPTTKGGESSLGEQIKADRQRTAAEGCPKTITLITIDDLALLVRLRPIKQVGLAAIRDMLRQCSLPEETHEWIEKIRNAKTSKPPYRQIVMTIQNMQKQWKQSAVKYGMLRVELSHATPPVKYETDTELVELCRGMAQMAPGAMYATETTVELDQSAENVLAAIEAAAKEYPADEQ